MTPLSGIRDGRPWTENDTGLITDMSTEEQERVKAWIHENLLPRKTPNLDRTSYGIKHILDRDIGIYTTNNQFKDAMLMCGFEPVDERCLNWNYCISKRSPAFKPTSKRRDLWT